VTVIDSIKKTILAAMKAVPLTSVEVEAVIDSMIEKGDITEEQGRKLRSALLGTPGKESEDAGHRIEGELHRLLGHLPFVSRREFLELRGRVQAIEDRLGPSGAQAPDEVPPRGAEGAGERPQPAFGERPPAGPEAGSP
jgi:polyhydroxyalkanoate synthesis regulator phasin